jgi:hypothetical protein
MRSDRGRMKLEKMEQFDICVAEVKSLIDSNRFKAQRGKIPKIACIGAVTN